MIKYYCKRAIDSELVEGFEFFTDNFAYSREHGYAGDMEEVQDLGDLDFKTGAVSVLEVEVSKEHYLDYVSECRSDGIYVSGFKVLKEYPINSYTFIKNIFVRLHLNTQKLLFIGYPDEFKLAVLNEVDNPEYFINLGLSLKTFKLIKQFLSIKELDIDRSKTNEQFIRLYNTSLLVNSTVDLNNLYTESNINEFSYDELGDIILNAHVINHKHILNSKVFLEASPYYLFVSLVLDASSEVSSPRKFLESLHDLLKSMTDIADIDYRKITFVKEVYYYTLGTIIEQVDLNIEKFNKDKLELLEKMKLEF